MNYDAVLNVERTYLYVTNVQGDVVAVINAANGQTAVSYEYDAWGKLISKTSSSSDYASVYEYNPLTYRGYIYDNETGFYYLQTRYYDPAIGRFINEDGQLNGGLLGCNLYAYCGNNPVMRIDSTGKFIWLAQSIISDSHSSSSCCSSISYYINAKQRGALQSKREQCISRR